jgi:hypothetical protein
MRARMREGKRDSLSSFPNCRAPDEQEFCLQIRGTNGNFKSSLTATIHLWRNAVVPLSTDKPLYQLDQTLHIRALLLDDRRRAWSKQPVRFLSASPTRSYSPRTRKRPFCL